MAHRIVRHTGRAARRAGITIAGIIVVLAGVAMLVLPGPGILTIILGLMILGVEFAFARRWLAKIKSTTRQAADRVRAKVTGKAPPGAS